MCNQILDRQRGQKICALHRPPVFSGAEAYTLGNQESPLGVFSQKRFFFAMNFAVSVTAACEAESVTYQIFRFRLLEELTADTLALGSATDH
jgi:hypothetical protein